MQQARGKKFMKNLVAKPQRNRQLVRSW